MGEVVRNLDKRRKPVTQSDRLAGEFPYYGANGIQDWVSDYIFDGTYLLVGEDGSVVTTAGNPVIHWAQGKIWVNNHAHVLEQSESGVNLRFLYHYLQTIDVRPFIRGGTQPKLNQGNLNKILVPCPSMELQGLIVEQLDALEGLAGDLVIGLPAELAARRKQYAYYRDKLLTFPQQVA
jgi:type I restriction enzyme S subunit